MTEISKGCIRVFVIFPLLGEDAMTKAAHLRQGLWFQMDCGRSMELRGHALSGEFKAERG